jgi:hypothetical protein
LEEKLYPVFLNEGLGDLETAVHFSANDGSKDLRISHTASVTKTATPILNNFELEEVSFIFPNNDIITIRIISSFLFSFTPRWLKFHQK